jgi:predicted dehydrogenase
VVGAGGIVRSAHLPAYNRASLPVAGIYDLRREVATKVAADFGIPRVFGSLAEALEQQGVVFDLAVPANAMLEIVEQLPPGCAVLLQKPMGRDLAEAIRILAACRARSLIAAVNLQLKFSPNMLALRHAIADGLLGAITDVEVRVNVHTPWELWDFLKGLPRHEFLYHSIHYLDLIRSLLGEPRGVYAKAVRSPLLPNYADTSSACLLDYGSTCRCVLSVNHSHAFGPRHKMSQIKIEGTRGAAVASMGVNLDYPQGEPDSLEVALLPESHWLPVKLEGNWFSHAFEGPMANLQRFASGLDPVLEASVEDAAKTMALVEACYRSSDTGATPIPELG